MSSADSIRSLEIDLFLRQRFLAFLGLRIGRALDFLEHAFCVDTPSGSSVTATLPLAARELLDRPARAHAQAAATGLVDGADRFRLRDDLPAAGKVRPRDESSSARRRVIFGLRIAATAAARLRSRLCDGMSVAMPTPMPDVPFSSSIGSRAGRSFGSLNAPS